MLSDESELMEFFVFAGVRMFCDAWKGTPMFSRFLATRWPYRNMKALVCSTY